MAAVSAGEQWRVARMVDVGVLTHWLAPFTGGYERTLPAGTVVRVLNDPVEGATAVGCRPDAYDEMHSGLVPDHDRLSEKYDGYSLVVDLDAFGRELERLYD